MPVKGMTQKEIDEATRAQVASGAKSTDRANRLPGETATEANARITAAYKAQPKPELTQEGKAAGAEIKFVRTEAGGVGEYKEVFPTGKPIPATRTTEYGNIYDAQGNLVQGTGLKTGVPGTSTAQRTPDQIAAYNNAKATAQQFVDLYGGALSDYFDAVTGRVTSPSKEVINKKFTTTATTTTATTSTATTTGKFPAGFTAGPFPKELEQFFGSSSGVLAYRIETLTDKNGRKYNQLSVATGPNSSQTYGASFIQGADGKYSIYTPTAVSPTTTTPTTTTSTTSTVVPTGLDAQTTALIKSLQDQITALNKQVTGTTTANTLAAEQKALEERQRKENALTSLTARFSKYGLESLVPKIRELVINGSTESTIAFELQETPEYKQRFKANTERLKKGLSVLDAGTYIGMEDSYRQALRAYGLKQFDTDDYVSQFIANDISANELSNRIVTAVQRVQNADPAITKQLKDFYNIGQNDLVAYVLDPNQQFQKIERQVQAAEIGVAAARQGINAGVQVAEQLAAQGVTQAEAQKGYATIADILPDAKRLSDIYGTTLEGYDLGQAEQEVFNQLASAQRRRQKLTQREIAAFGGQSGLSTKALTTDLTGQY